MPREFQFGIAEDPGLTRSTLLSGLRNKDEVAWARFAELYTPLVFSWCRRDGCSTDDARDVVQDVFTSVAANIQRLRHDSGDSFRAWLRTVTRNRVIDYHRKNQKRPNAVGGTDANEKFHQHAEQLEDSDDGSPEQERAQLLSRALQMVKSDFEESTWHAFWQSTVDGDSTAEIAERLHMKPNAVRQARYRVIRRIREEFGQLLD